MRTLVNKQDDVWPARWDGHERAQLRRLSRLPLAEKLRWLEEADELVRHLRQARQPLAREGATNARRSPSG
jgi:hypothetical protein